MKTKQQYCFIKDKQIVYTWFEASHKIDWVEITWIPIKDINLLKINNWYDITIIKWIASYYKWTRFLERQKEKEDKFIMQLKLEKKEAINKIATLSDQLNLLATVLDILTKWNTDPIILESKAKFAEIKTILNN